jgi:DNA-binding LytR/AlgR family response regulator
VDGGSTAVITQEGEFLIRKPVKELAKELDSETFWQIYHGIIVNVRFIDKVSRSLTDRCILKLKGISDFAWVVLSRISAARRP